MSTENDDPPADGHQTSNAEYKPAELAVPGQRDAGSDWQRVQAGFVDDPRSSVEQAAAMVAAAAEKILATIEERERRLRDSWEGNGADTEALRIALREYRVLYQQISQL